MGVTLEDGVGQNEQLWPSTWGEHNQDNDGYDGTVAVDQIADADNNHAGESLGQAYEYEPLDFTINDTLEGQNE
jgi:hypothetical protein